MSKLNWQIILSNIIEAREQLQEIERLVEDGTQPSKGEFQVMLEHCFHHLSFAWNVRKVSIEKYANLSDKDFNKWSKIPKEIEPLKIRTDRKKK